MEETAVQFDEMLMALKKMQEQFAEKGDLPGPRFEIHYSGDYHHKDGRRSPDHAPFQEAA